MCDFFANQRNACDLFDYKFCVEMNATVHKQRKIFTYKSNSTSYATICKIILRTTQTKQFPYTQSLTSSKFRKLFNLIVIYYTKMKAIFHLKNFC